jgi:hypothetical protein
VGKGLLRVGPLSRVALQQVLQKVSALFAQVGEGGLGTSDGGPFWVGQHASKTLVEYDAEGPDVYPEVAGAALEELGGGEGLGAQGLEEEGLVGEGGVAEVDDLGLAGAVNQHVFGF